MSSIASIPAAIKRGILGDYIASTYPVEFSLWASYEDEDPLTEANSEIYTDIQFSFNEPRFVDWRRAAVQHVRDNRHDFELAIGLTLQEEINDFNLIDIELWDDGYSIGITFTTTYEKDVDDQDRYVKVDWDSERGKRIIAEMKQIYVSTLTRLTRELFPSSTTRPQPYLTKNENGDTVDGFGRAINNLQDVQNYDPRNDYKLQNDIIHQAAFWEEKLNNETETRWHRGRVPYWRNEFNVRRFSFNLVNNKQLPLVKGVGEGNVMRQLKF